MARSIISNKNTNSESTQTTQETQKNQEVQKKQRVRLDETMLVSVVSRVKGGLTYVSRQTQIPYRWDDYGVEQVMELRELRSMLGSQRKFFDRGWIEVLDPEVIEYLNLERFQKKVITDEDVDYIFSNAKPEEIKELLAQSSANNKRIVFGFAREKYLNGELSNIHIIKAIEEALGQKLDPNS
jgi:hypothetical protein